MRVSDSHYNHVLCIHDTLGICEDVMEDVLLSAKKCSHEDVFHYDGEERFCLLAYLALWLVGVSNGYPIM